MASSSKSPASDSQDQDQSSQSYEYTNLVLDSKLRAGLNEFRLNKMFCDVTLVTGNVLIPAHKVVLASCSDYFHAMFTQGFKEKESSTISMKGLNSEIIISLVECMYTNRITITQDNVTNLYSASKMLQFSGITRACSQFLINHIELDNCFEVKLFARAHDDADLLSKCDSYIQEHFAEIVEQEEFLELNKNDLFDLLASDKIFLENEEQVFECLVSWINKAEDCRSQYFPDLMKLLRLPFLSSDYLTMKVLNEPLTNQFVIWKDSITQLVMDRHLKDSSQYEEGLCINPRQYLRPNAMLVMGGKSSDGSTLKSVECFDFMENQWSAEWEMPITKLGFRGVVVRGKVYLVGKYGRFRYGVYDMYDPCSYTWTSSSLSGPRVSGLGVAVLNERIYAVGGKDVIGESHNTAEMLDVTENQKWRNISKMNTRRSDVGLVSMNGKLYAVGGHDGRHWLSSVESYDPEQNIWVPVADLCTKGWGRCICTQWNPVLCRGPE